MSEGGMGREQTPNNTFGDLIVALTDEAGRFVHEEEYIYKVVAYIVSDLLYSSRLFFRRWH
jgi:hypothetical protein